jgi:DNA-binding MarR family transcriptional regulator
MDRTTLTAALKPLERRGLVAVRVNPSDARSRLIALTGEGLALLSRAVPVWRSTHAEVDRLLDEHDPGSVRSALRALS